MESSNRSWRTDRRRVPLALWCLQTGSPSLPRTKTQKHIALTSAYIFVYLSDLVLSADVSGDLLISTLLNIVGISWHRLSLYHPWYYLRCRPLQTAYSARQSRATSRHSLLLAYSHSRTILHLPNTLLLPFNSDSSRRTFTCARFIVPGRIATRSFFHPRPSETPRSEH
jgi:hypothetical protein